MSSITFKQFVNEAAAGHESPKFTAISGDILEYLKKHCSDALWMLNTKSTRIYRGDSESNLGKSGYAYVDPSLTERASENTSNYYTEIFDNIPSMQKFPKRSRSFIASTDQTRASEYDDDGNVIVLIPFNGVKIGSVENTDMWDTTINFFGKDKQIETLNSVFDNLIGSDSWESILEYDSKLKAADAESNEDDVETAKRAAYKLKRFYTLFPKWSYPKSIHLQFLEEIKRAYSPSETGFKVYTTKTLPKTDHESEVWVGGPCVALTVEALFEIMKAYNPGEHRDDDL